MPSAELFAAPVQPRTLRLSIEWTPENPDSVYTARVTLEGTKRSLIGTEFLPAPEGALEMLPEALDAIVHAFMWSPVRDAALRTTRGQRTRLRFFADQQTGF